ncbi:MAG TPA: BPSS1780 family membrane protein [Casimicrobiaceae bacterium]|nr:BPSS1780 family membrane protein [Casimicrobiaceae bacterium]
MATTARDIGYTRYEGRRGILWLRESYAMFARHRRAWIMLLLAYYATLLLVQALPWVGAVVAPLIKPVLSVSFLAAAWTQERGGKPAISMLLRGFRANLGALLPLGFVFVVGISIALTATALVDGGQLLDALYGAAPSADDDPDAATRAFVTTLQSPRVMAAIVFGALCALPTLLALWWAPALVVFQDAGPFTALRASIRAAIGNWRATLRYAIGIVVFGVVIPTSISAMLALVLPPPINATLAALIVLPYVAFFVATLHICDYVSYRDVFHAGEEATQ